MLRRNENYKRNLKMYKILKMLLELYFLGGLEQSNGDRKTWVGIPATVEDLFFKYILTIGAKVLSQNKSRKNLPARTSTNFPGIFHSRAEEKGG